MRYIAPFYSSLLVTTAIAHSATVSAEVAEPTQVSLPLLLDVETSFQKPLACGVENRLIESNIGIRVPYYALVSEVAVEFVEEPSDPIDIARHAMKAIILEDYGEFQSVCEESNNCAVSLTALHDDLKKRLNGQEPSMTISGYYELEQARVYKCTEINTGITAAITVVLKSGEWKARAILELRDTDGLKLAVEYAVEKPSQVATNNHNLEFVLPDTHGRVEAYISLNALRVQENPVLLQYRTTSAAVPTTDSGAANKVLAFVQESLHLLSEIPRNTEYESSAAYSGFINRLTPASRENLKYLLSDKEDEQILRNLAYLHLRYTEVYPWCVVVSEPFYFIFYTNKAIVGENDTIDEQKLRNASHSDFLTVIKGDDEFALEQFDVRWKQVPIRMPELIFCTERFKNALKEAILDGGAK